MLGGNVDQTGQNGKERPNVIVVMSEAFADFRPVAKRLGLQTNDYKQFDAVGAEGYKGTAVVPTFASFTVRTEFELLFGLPVRSLNDPNMPQQLMKDRPQPTLARYYKENGYATAYVHPFLRTFYNREEVYSNFGFDTMLFEDDFTVDVNYYGAYIDDETVFNQILKLVQDTDQPLYLHTTTMQNHQPYNKGRIRTQGFDSYRPGSLGRGVPAGVHQCAEQAGQTPSRTVCEITSVSEGRTACTTSWGSTGTTARCCTSSPIICGAITSWITAACRIRSCPPSICPMW